MFGCMNITSNVDGIPYLRTRSISVGTEAVDLVLGFRKIPPVGYLTINVATAIPEGTTGTLPLRLVLNGGTRNLTFFGGDNVTVADIAGTGVITVFYDWYNGLLQIISPTSA